MRRLPHCRVVHVQVVANSADHDFPGVEPHPDTHLNAVDAAHRFCVLAHGRLHRQGGVAGAQGVIFVGQRSPKEGHNAVAQHLVHRALIAVHGLHHAVQSGVEELLGGFRVEVLNQLGRVLDIGKQHRHLFAFTFQGTAGGEDLLGEIRWGISQRSTSIVRSG